jgi:hypothetical protein
MACSSRVLNTAVTQFDVATIKFKCFGQFIEGGQKIQRCVHREGNVLLTLEFVNDLNDTNYYSNTQRNYLKMNT